jgi:NADPH2:quinone reductase
MKRVTVKEYGGANQLIVESAAESLRPGPGQVLIDVEAAGVNYIDVYQRKGIYKLPLPFTPGLEGVGRVREVGKSDDKSINNLVVGQRLAWINVQGSYASRLVIPVAQVIPIPDTFTVAQALLFQGLTAQYLVSEYRDVRDGDRVLIHSAAGGVGQLLVQWFKHLGAWVVGTTSSDAKASVARAAGANAVINYGHDYEFLDELMSLTNGQGVHLAIDGVGAATLEKTLQGLARGGIAVSIGSASGPPPAIQPGQLTQRGLRLAGGSVFSYTADAVELQQRASAVVEAIQARWLRVGDGTAYQLDRVADAHRDIEERGTQGKLYLTP